MSTRDDEDLVYRGPSTVLGARLIENRRLVAIDRVPMCPTVMSDGEDGTRPHTCVLPWGHSGEHEADELLTATEEIMLQL